MNGWTFFTHVNLDTLAKIHYFIVDTIKHKYSCDGLHHTDKESKVQ